MAQLNHCKAYINEQMPIWLQDAETGEIYHLMGDTLVSYNSTVAFMANDGMLYLLPRYSYSATTRQHLRKFITDFERREYLGLDTYRKDRTKAIMCSGYSWNGLQFWSY